MQRRTYAALAAWYRSHANAAALQTLTSQVNAALTALPAASAQHQAYAVLSRRLFVALHPAGPKARTAARASAVSVRH